jgi:TRAP-type mannitol/chloroaromatic compound transport system permease small subunit
METGNMRTALRRFARGCDAISEWSGTIMSYLLILVVAIMFFETISRYFFNAPTRWAHESCQILFAIYALSMGAHALLHGTHVRMDLIYSHLSDRGKAIMDIITVPMFYFWTVLLFIYGSKFALDSMSYWERSTSVWAPPIWEVKLMIPIAALLYILQGTAILIRNILFAVRGEEL